MPDCIGLCEGISLFFVSLLQSFSDCNRDVCHGLCEKRRLSCAALEIAESAKNIKEIAFDWGFNSHENFVRVFHKEFGISPTQYRKSRYSLHLFRKINLEQENVNSDYGTLQLEPEFITLPTLKIAGISVETSFENTRHYTDIPTLLNKYYANRLWETIPNKVYTDYRTDYGFSSRYSSNGQDFDWVIGVKVKNIYDLPVGVVGKVVPKASYAVFRSLPSNEYNMIDNLIKTWRYIYFYWLPNSGYYHANTHELEAFSPEIDPFTKYIHIPIIKKI